ncbi:hypothetical protein [Nonomuraea roseoviolacea]|uniref:hypothetical protein n=1 Tax=Nonomuraea roseoviolacea TaxID=103837 RepID=UPI0031E0F115
MRVTVIAAPCDPRWTTRAGRPALDDPGRAGAGGSRHFGYACDHLPLQPPRTPVSGGRG